MKGSVNLLPQKLYSRTASGTRASMTFWILGGAFVELQNWVTSQTIRTLSKGTSSIEITTAYGLKLSGKSHIYIIFQG